MSGWHVGEVGHFPAAAHGDSPWEELVLERRGLHHIWWTQNRRVHLGKAALLQLITWLRSCVVRSCFPRIQVNKAFKAPKPGRSSSLTSQGFL